MLQWHVSYVSWLGCYSTLVIFLPCCHVSRYEKLRLHSHVTPLLFTTLKHETYTIWKMLHMHVSVTKAWWDRWCTCLWNEMQLVEAKHLGCYTDHMDYALRGGPAYKTKPCGVRLCSAPFARHLEDILKILWDLLGYVWSHDSCNLLLFSGYLLNLTDL